MSWVVWVVLVCSAAWLVSSAVVWLLGLLEFWLNEMEDMKMSKKKIVPGRGHFPKRTGYAPKSQLTFEEAEKLEAVRKAKKDKFKSLDCLESKDWKGEKPTTNFRGQDHCPVSLSAIAQPLVRQLWVEAKWAQSQLEYAHLVHKKIRHGCAEFFCDECDGGKGQG